MKNLKRLYLIPTLLAILLATGLALSLFPKESFLKIGVCVALPMLVMVIGFRMITTHRMRLVRQQLYQILQTLEAFDVDEPAKVTFEPSPFPIFNELNDYLIELINRIRKNYQANKQFTQNASHELQTPLSIIKGNIELLLQSSNLGEKEINALGIVMQNTNRLARLNSALILLSKIEHQRFVDTKMVQFTELTDEVLQNFQDLIEIQEIRITKDYQASFAVSMSQTLAEVLIANLVQNAIRHNVSGGTIHISIKAGLYTISNSGKALSAAPHTLFKRFRRESDNESSLGLGLSIIKRICEQAGLTITYRHQAGQHELELKPIV